MSATSARRQSMPMRTFLGVDLGTSGLKLTLLDEVGVVRGESEAAYELS